MAGHPTNTSDVLHDSFLRVKADKVSRLLDLVGEFGLAAGNVTRHPALAHLDLDGFDLAVHQLDLLIRELQDLAAGLRLVPVSDAFQRIQRLVRDLSRQTGKSLALDVTGGDTEIDKVLVDQLVDPLMHLVRNAADHGIEPVDVRRAAGKPEQGRISLSASQQGSEILILIADDGRGLDRAAILAKARTQGLLQADEEPDDQAVWRFIFHSGFSTAKEVSNLSGRGVGMDVVNTAIEALRGHIEVDSQAGQGTRISLRIPLTLAFLDSMVVRLDERFFAIPVDVVGEVFQPTSTQVKQTSINGGEMVHVRNEYVPVCRMQQFYDQECLRLTPLPEQIVIVVRTHSGVMGIAVDEIVGQQQVTMKPLQGQLANIRAGAGYALLGSGDIAIALDCQRLMREIDQS